MNDPNHPILDQPWRWKIESFAWHSANDSMQSALDVRFVQDGRRRTLRFIEPHDVVIQFGGQLPVECGDMAILDIRRRQLDGLSVQVADCGASGTPLRLYARSVQEIDD